MTPAYEFLDATPDFRGLAVAVGVGLLVGLERERRHGNDGIEHVAGIRTFALLAVVGVVSSWLGVVAQAMVLFAVASLAVIAYVRETSGDRGLTTEVAMLAITLLGMLSTPYPEWSAGLGVLVAVLLAAKTTMHRFSRQVLTAGEV
ncbi:MAG: MgtC/SapB family protein, partial [Xanthomonadales bacterium]|nr:MgtC/SapB family protein [Xanthomonadales bacterium]